MSRDAAQNPRRAALGTVAHAGSSRNAPRLARMTPPATRSGSRFPTIREAATSITAEAGNWPAFNAVSAAPMRCGRPVACRNSGMNALAPKYAAEEPACRSPSRHVNDLSQSGRQYRRAGAGPAADGIFAP